MNDFNKNLNIFCFILAATAIILILSGIFIGYAFKFLGINVSKSILLIFQSAFILSGIGDFCLLGYVYKKLK